MNPRTEQPWIDTEAAHETVCNVRRVSLDFRIQPAPEGSHVMDWTMGAVMVGFVLILTLAMVVTP